MSDKSERGPKDDKCLELTKLHSIAVGMFHSYPSFISYHLLDYPKTGVPAVIPPHLRVNKEEGYPDFMEKKGKQQYVSSKVYTFSSSFLFIVYFVHSYLLLLFKTLGILYRKVKPATNNTHALTTLDPHLIVDGHEDYLEDALISKTEYNFRIISLLNQYGVKTEAELVCFSFYH